jgi:hypothetical protein
VEALIASNDPRMSSFEAEANSFLCAKAKASAFRSAIWPARRRRRDQMQNESRASMMTTQPPDAAPAIIPICDVLELLDEDALAVAEEAETVIVPPAEDGAGVAEPKTDARDRMPEALGAVENVPDWGDVVDKVPAEGEAVNALAGLNVLVEPGDGVDVSMDSAACEVADTLSGVGVPDADDMAEVDEATDDESDGLGEEAVDESGPSGST